MSKFMTFVALSVLPKTGSGFFLQSIGRSGARVPSMGRGISISFMGVYESLWATRPRNSLTGPPDVRGPATGKLIGTCIPGHLLSSKVAFH
ncbi:hypothetical protein FKM82_027341 [Ascaphus truei]